MAIRYCIAVNRTKSRTYMSTFHATYFGFTLELLVKLVDKVWIGPIKALLRSKVFDMAVLKAIACRHSQISRTSAENLITTRSRYKIS